MSVAVQERPTITLTQSELLIKALDYLLNAGDILSAEDAEDALYYFVKAEDGLSPSEEFEAFQLCRKHYRKLNKAEIVLPTKAQWKSTYQINGLEVWNLTKRTGPYTLKWVGGTALECDCEAYQHGNECGHVRFAYTQLKAPNAVPTVEAKPIAPVVMTQHEILPGIYATESQWEALQNLISFANGDRGGMYLLTGQAGTGKTALVQALAQAVQGLKIAFTAPTNKAVRVLGAMVSQWGLGVDCMTCASLLGLQPSREGTEMTFDRDPAAPCLASNYDLIVVDECSMESESLWDHHLREITLKTRILFMGDDKQAPPIGEAISKTFTQVPDQSNLTQVMRYGGDIGTVAQDIRNNLSRNIAPVIVTSHNADKSQGVWVLPRKTWNTALIKAFTGVEYSKNSNAVRAIAYTNKRVERINQMVRDVIQGKDAPQYLVGERLIARNHYSMTDRDGTEVKIFASADEMEVTQAVEGKQGEWKVWFLTVQILGDARQPMTVPVIHQDSLRDYRAKLKEYANTGHHDRYWHLLGRFAQVRHAYCLTAHQSQGSTFKNVFVDVPNILGNNTKNMVQFPGTSAPQLVWERNQLLYVAVSRASQRLFVPE
jgi:energy-coupling factor transporter ATP-binding protein EcfA2